MTEDVITTLGVVSDSRVEILSKSVLVFVLVKSTICSYQTRSCMRFSFPVFIADIMIWYSRTGSVRGISQEENIPTFLLSQSESSTSATSKVTSSLKKYGSSLNPISASCHCKRTNHVSKLSLHSALGEGVEYVTNDLILRLRGDYCTLIWTQRNV